MFKKICIVMVIMINIGWSYKQTPMVTCVWCGRTSHLNRHHILPQSFYPELVNTPTNIVVLCRDCHFVLAHRCNWKTYNPDLMIILTTYTNTVIEKEAKD
jgi:hypothetical protein